jgi:hypothetical protein
MAKKKQRKPAGKQNGKSVPPPPKPTNKGKKKR